MSGLLITMEGVEGSGKSTQIQALMQRLHHLGLPVLLSKEPGGTPLGAELRRLLLAPHASGETWCAQSELLLFYADRAQHLERLVRPALRAGKIVVIDRFEDSTRAYQGASGVPDEALDALSRLVLTGLKPHLTVLLDLDPELSMKRVEARNTALGADFQETRFDSEALVFHRRIREKFLGVAHAEPDRVALIAADQRPEQVAEAIWIKVAALLHTQGFREA